MRTGLCLFALAAACAAPATPGETTRIPVAGTSPLTEVFTRVSRDTGVPADLLAAVSWTETRFHFAQPDVHSHAFEYGPLALTDGGPRDLQRGAALAGVSDAAARTEVEASIRAGAALLRDYALANHGDYTAALRSYGGDSFAHSIQRALARGIDGRDDAGLSVTIAARFDAKSGATSGYGTVTQASGYAGAEWIPAHSGNYSASNRGVGDIKHIIIHNTEGSYNGTISWFKNSAANVSAHYLLRSSDGHVAQMVDEKDVAWHVKCFNAAAVGIEHEGYAAKPETWFTEAMYAESAKLTAYLADKYMIAKTHSPSTIMGHGEAPDCSDHTDPGPGWNWDHYFDLVRTGGASNFNGEDIVVDAPAVITSGQTATVTVTINNSGTAAWDLDATRIGTQDPTDRESPFYVEGDWLSPSRATAVDAQTAPGTAGTFTFEIRGPEVAEPTVYDETFSFVQEDVTWFGPTFHVVLQVRPDTTDDVMPSGGCSTGRSGSGIAGIGFGLLAALGARRRRRR
jgi:N-acetylmuramoyl-L-alanine amidase